MAFTIDEKYESITQKIMSNLPTSQFVVDLVGEAIQTAIQHFEGFELDTRLDVAYKMSVYAKEVSQPMYFMTHLVLAPLLAGLEGSEVSRLDTASGALTKALAPLSTFVAGKTFKQKWKALFNLSTVDKDVMAAALMFAKAYVEKAFKEKDFYTLAGYGYLEVNIRQSGMFINHTVRKYYNEFASLVLNKYEY